LKQVTSTKPGFDLSYTVNRKRNSDGDPPSLSVKNRRVVVDPNVSGKNEKNVLMF